MADHTPYPEPQEPSVAFLLAEYQLLRERFISLQQERVQRLNFFIALTLACLGVVLYLGGTTRMRPDIFLLLVQVALLLLAAVGADLVMFLVMRERVIDRVERGMARIRHYFVERDPGLARYVILATSDESTLHVRNLKVMGLQRAAQVVQGITVALAATLLAYLLNTPLYLSMGVGAVAFVVDYLALESYTRETLKQAAAQAQREANFPPAEKPA
ncbi:MAG: hypothetical protein ACKOC5_12575 [Chloroflexota bacterium]